MTSAPDALDRALLFLLQDDGRRTASDIAEITGMPVWDVARRIASFEADGLITGAPGRLDPAKAGFPLTAFLRVRLADDKRQSMDAFADAVLVAPEVVQCWRLDARGAYLLRVVARDETDLERIRADIVERMPGALAVATTPIVETIKDTSKLPL